MCWFYFNKKYSRSGHLFQNRFNSKCVENQRYFITKGKSENKEDFIEYEMRVKIEDSELSELLVKELKLNNINEFKELDEEEFKKGIEFLKNLQYTSFNQISRVVRINRYQLEKYWKWGALWNLQTGTASQQKGTVPICREK